MTLSEILDKARKSGVEVKESFTFPGRYKLTKKGMVNMEAFNVCGHAAIIIDATGRYPAQMSAEDIDDIIFPV